MEDWLEERELWIGVVCVCLHYVYDMYQCERRFVHSVVGILAWRYEIGATRKPQLKNYYSLPYCITKVFHLHSRHSL